MLVECDPALLPSVSQREFDLDSGTGALALRNLSMNGGFSAAPECMVMLPAENRPYPASVRHAPTGESILTRGRCDGPGGSWKLTPTGEIKHTPSGACAVYSTSNWSVAVFPESCRMAAAAGSGLGTKWVYDKKTGFLRAAQWAPGKADGREPVTRGVPQNVPHCLAAPIPNVNVSLGMAALLLRGNGGGSVL